MTNPLTDNFIEDSALKNDNANFNPLTPYNYGKNVPLTPLSSILSLSVADGDKILSLDETVLSSNLSIKYENNILSLVGKNGEIITSINLPLAQILNQAYYDSETKELVFVFSTSTGETKTTINVGDLVDTYTAGKGLTLSGNQFAIDETVVGTKEDVKIINDNLVQAINTINQNMADGFNTINGGIENEIKPEIAKKVEWTDIHTDDYPERKAIVVKNHDMILGTDTTGGTYNLAMVSKWDVADYGSNKLPFNINSKERPTVQLPDVSGEDAEKIAFLSDIPNTDNFATKDELNAVDSKFGDRFESGNTVSASITNIEQNLEGEASLRKQADEQIALNLQGVSDRVSAIEAQTSGSSEFDAIKSDVETLKTDNTAIKSDIEALKAEDAVIKPDVEALKADDVTIKSDINSLKESVANKIDWLDIHTEEYPERKAIVLKNHDMILGTDTTGSTYNLAMISKWDIADFGTNKLDFNINSKERPTVQLPGVSGEDAEKIAFLSDIPNTENFATKDELNAVDAKIGDGFESGNTISAAIKGEVALREQADNQIAQNLQNISNDVETLKTDNATIKSDVEALKAEDVTIKSDIDSLKNNVANKIDWADIHTDDYPERKAIVLKNHDMLLGTDTTGGTYNLAMINKWDVADYGTPNLLTNLNSKERPTVQLPGVSGEDAEKIAFLSDIPNTDNFATKDEISNKISASDIQSKLTLAETTDSLHYQLSYDGTSLGEITIPEDQFLESVSYISAATESDRIIEPSIVIVGDPYLRFIFRITGSKKVYTYIPIKTIVSNLATKDEVSKLGIVDLGNFSTSREAESKAAEQALTANNIIFKYTINNSSNGIIYNSILKDGGAVQTIILNGEMYKRSISAEGTVDDWQIDSRVIIAGKYINSMTLFKLTTSASSQDVQNSLKYDGLNSKVITKADLDNCLKYGCLLQDAIMREMVQVSWNGNSYVLTEIAHFSPKTDIKCGTIAINVTDAGEYSVTKDGTIDTILTDKNISKNSVISNVMNELNSFAVLYDRISMLESKLDSLTLEGAESVSEFDGTQSLNDTGKSYVITTGSITNSNTIAGKNVSISDSTLTNNARLTVNAKSVDFNKLSVSGDFPKANGNSVIKVNDSDYITFKDLTFDSSNVYNGIEIGLSTSASTLPKNIIFENCKFTGTFANNAILVFGTQDNAIITLSNCSFDKVSNVLRLSNRTNAKNVTVNVVNCSVNQWDTNEYAGFLLCQDYTSSISDVDTNNLFGDGKITVNFVNLMHKGSKVMPTDVASVCGVGNDSQVVYVYTDANNAITSYSSDKYPVIKFS